MEDWTMNISELLLPELDQESASTRKVLSALPADKLDWKPHEKSMSFRGLATHVANMPKWAVMTIDADSFDIAPSGEDATHEEAVTSVEHALKMFDENVAAARTAIAGTNDEHLMAPWTLMSGGGTLFTMPRYSVVRSMIMNHLIHHRAQLGVYMRLNDMPMPSTYGPTADDTPGG
jgi:uncharacterized damage-inducible protein DinB